MTLSEFRERLKALHPVLKGVIFTALASLTFFIEQWLVSNSLNLKKEALQKYHFFAMDTLKGVLDLVLLAPLEEELIYRGPVWILAMYAGLTIRRNPGNRQLAFTAYALCAILGLALNYVWAFSHTHHPYTIFMFGIVWGGCLIATRRLHYAILLHAGSNAFGVISTSLIHHFSN